MLADLRVRGEQQVVERLPAVVAARGAAFDLHEDLRRCHRARDRRDLADLLDRAGFERDATARAIAATWRICSTVPGLNATNGKPSALSARTSSTASSSSGMPAETTTPSIGAPLARFFGTMRCAPNCRDSTGSGP